MDFEQIIQNKLLKQELEEKEKERIQEEQKNAYVYAQQELSARGLVLSEAELQEKVNYALTTNIDLDGAVSDVVKQVSEEAERTAFVRTLDEKIANHEPLSAAEETSYEHATGRDVGGVGFMDTIQQTLYKYEKEPTTESRLFSAIQDQRYEEELANDEFERTRGEDD